MRRMMWASLLALLTVVACSESSRQPARSACDLLTSSEVERVTMAKVAKSGPVSLIAGSASSDPELTACAFETSSPVGSVLVTLQRRGASAFNEARLRPPIDASTVKDVPGLGDQAFTAHEAVSVLMGDTYVTVSAQNETAGFSLQAIQMARIALTRAT